MGFASRQGATISDYEKTPRQAIHMSLWQCSLGANTETRTFRLDLSARSQSGISLLSA